MPSMSNAGVGTQLAAYGFQVFTDKHLEIGVEWARNWSNNSRARMPSFH
jgi:hypothetical protein